MLPSQPQNLTSQACYMSTDRVLFIVNSQEPRMTEFPTHTCLCNNHKEAKGKWQSCACFYNFSEVTYLLSLIFDWPNKSYGHERSRKYNPSIWLERKCMKSPLRKHDKNKELNKDIQMHCQLKILATHNDTC